MPSDGAAGGETGTYLLHKEQAVPADVTYDPTKSGAIKLVTLAVT